MIDPLRRTPPPPGWDTPVEPSRRVTPRGGLIGALIGSQAVAFAVVAFAPWHPALYAACSAWAVAAAVFTALTVWCPTVLPEQPADDPED